MVCSSTPVWSSRWRRPAKRSRPLKVWPARTDGADKVTGRAVYGGDMRLTGMLHGKVLRSPHAHARIKAINTAKAEALPGVRAVITAKDFPPAEDRMANLGEMSVNVKYLSNNVMAADKALY